MALPKVKEELVASGFSGKGFANYGAFLTILTLRTFDVKNVVCTPKSTKAHKKKDGKKHQKKIALTREKESPGKKSFRAHARKNNHLPGLAHTNPNPKVRKSGAVGKAVLAQDPGFDGAKSCFFKQNK